MGIYAGAGLLALLLTWIWTPFVQKVSTRLHIVDEPNERRINRVPMPSAGGVAIYLGFWIAAGSLWLSGHGADVQGMFLASSLVLVVGLIDDRWTLKPWLKLGGQVAAALLLVTMGTRIEFVTNPFGGMFYLGMWGVPVTVLWLVAFTNMMNFIDGLDGLAAGVGSIACFPLFVVALQAGRPEAALLTMALAGAAVGFLRYNFNPARIFMGDSGAMFLGFMLAAISVEGALKGAATLSLAIPLIALGVPFLDTVFAIARRVTSGRPVYEADKLHLHHKLLALGLTHRQVVLVLYAVSATLSFGALALVQLTPAEGLMVFLGVLVAIGLGARRSGLLRKMG